MLITDISCQVGISQASEAVPPQATLSIAQHAVKVVEWGQLFHVVVWVDLISIKLGRKPTECQRSKLDCLLVMRPTTSTSSTTRSVDRHRGGSICFPQLVEDVSENLLLFEKYTGCLGTLSEQSDEMQHYVDDCVVRELIHDMSIETID